MVGKRDGNGIGGKGKEGEVEERDDRGREGERDWGGINRD